MMDLNVVRMNHSKRIVPKGGFGTLRLVLLFIISGGSNT